MCPEPNASHAGAPKGMNARAVATGMNANAGASQNSDRSAFAGMISSLNASLMPSASGWSDPGTS